jgi:hypothetical protein
MRCVAIAACIARVFAEQLFLPTPLLHPDSGMADFMSRQAYENSKRASTFRALLLATLLHEQANASRQQVKDACEIVADLVGGLLSVNTDKTFRAKLSVVATNAQVVWAQILRQTECFEVEFDETSCELSWQRLVLNEGKWSTQTDDPADDNGPPSGLVVFPRLYMIGDEVESPVTQGLFFAWEQTLQARKELSQMPATSGKQRRVSTQPRTLRPRGTLAIDGTSQG